MGLAAVAKSLLHTRQPYLKGTSRVLCAGTRSQGLPVG